jgi:integrase
MTQNDTSRQTLADVISAVLQADLTPLQRRDQISAVRTVARLLEAPPEAIRADVPMLRKRLDELSPGAAGVSPGRWANIRSLFGRALGQVRAMQPSRSQTPVSTDWEGLLSTLDRNRATRLRPLVRHLSNRGVGPAKVTLGHLEGYRDALLNDRLRRRPERTWDGLTWAWNACSREVLGWPKVLIDRPSRKESYVLPWTSFQPAFVAAVDQFIEWRGGFNLSEEGPARPARAATLKKRRDQLRVAASALVHQGHPVADLTCLRDLVTEDNMRSILNFMLDRHDRKPVPSIGYMAVFLKYVAEKYLDLDEQTLVKIKKLTRKLVSNRRGLTPRNRERLRPFDDPQTVAEFLALPARIREELSKDRRAAKPKALLAQAAAAIAIQQAVPLRIRNLAGIDVRKNLIERSGRVYLVFPETDTKNGEPIEFEIPERTLDPLAWYIREHRPALLNGPSDALFPGESGGAKSAALLSNQLAKVFYRYLGLRIHAHLLRHIAAKIFLDQRPGQYEVVRQVLRHRSIETTTAFYAGAETRSAGAHFAAVLDERRSQSDIFRRRGRGAAGLIARATRS